MPFWHDVQNYSEVGKRAIASILLSKESQSLLMNCDHSDHWYFYFFNKVSSDSWEDFDLSNISIITFNYDRSFSIICLEQFVAHMEYL